MRVYLLFHLNNKHIKWMPLHKYVLRSQHYLL